MNQNDMNNQPRMVTPEEIQQVNHISPEELQETQVLNLRDVQEAMKFEKRTSKKPAIILGIVYSKLSGIFISKFRGLLKCAE